MSLTEIYPEGAVLLAPLAGYTDRPYRASMRRHGCLYAFTEMVDAESLIYATRKSLYYIDPDQEGEWLGVQLVSNSPSALARAVPLLPEGRFRVIDFNLGCPAPKVAKKGEGAVLARREPELALRCVEALVKSAGDVPVTVKMRILSETDTEKTVRFARDLEAAGITAMTLHGRVMEKFYSGEVFTDVLKAVKSSLQIPLIANGGVMDRQSAESLKTSSGCSRLMVARGSQGNPWIFRELSDPDFMGLTLEELLTELRLYLDDMQLYYGSERGLSVARKTVLDFLRGRGFSGSLRHAAARVGLEMGVDELLKEVGRGPSESYWQWLALNPSAPRRLNRG